MDDQEHTTQRVAVTILDSVLPDADADGARLEPCLVILSGHERGRSVRLTRPHTSFGRGKDADIVLVDPKLSRRHGVLIVDGDGVELADADSTNGTFLDGQRIQRTPVGPNARIRAGDTIMKIEFKHPDEVAAEISLYEAANTDPLTGALNRRAFMTRAEREVADARRSGHAVSLLMCDIDHFKRINDELGHPAGDQVLRDLTRILRAHIRKDDLLARFGGEEFVLLLRNSNLQAGVDRAERIRLAVERHPFLFADRRITVTLSMGITSLPPGRNADIDSMIHLADAALYRAKQRGRNRVVSVDPAGD